MSNKEVLFKLVKIANNQLRILSQLAASDVDEEEYDDSEEGRQKYLQNHGKKLLEQSKSLSDDLPDTFNNVLNYMTNQKGSWDYRHIFYQLKELAASNEMMWGEIGEYYPGWSPKHFVILLEKLK